MSIYIEENSLPFFCLVFEFTDHKVDWNPDTQEITVIYSTYEEKNG
ncbi:MAG: hypothetical protein PHI40_07140 [Caldisericia bacterium]|nr:hypothetical protein [Caldisericia bacterium]MDD4615157.1 hypothetical protein [Caldisericia bacterium]